MSDAALPDDANPVYDGRVIFHCDLVLGGCPAGQKCAYVVIATQPTVAGDTECVADGTVGPDEPCLRQPALVDGGTGTDNCEAGLWCNERGVCQRICERFGEECSPTEACWPATLNGQDIFGTSHGLCYPSCDPVNQDCGASQTCYVSISFGVGRCSEPVGSAMHGATCGTIDACASGLGCVLRDSPAGENLVCAAFCDPVASPGSPTHCDTIVGADYECRSLIDFWPEYSARWIFGSEVGVCVDPVVWP